MRIGITCYPSHGGSGVVATELGKHLAHWGHEVAFISYSAPLRLGHIPERVTFHEVEAVEYPLLKNYPYTLALASKMIAVARQRRLQVLHVHYAIPFAPAALMAKYAAPELDLRVVTTLHGTDITLVGNDPTFKPITKWAIEQSDAVTAVSHFLRDQARNEFEIEREMDVVYNFIDPERHERPCPGCIQPRSSPDEVTLMHISNFRPVKRVEDVVRVFARVRKQMPARLIMVGDGPTACTALQVALSLGVADSVQFTGVVEEIEPVLQQADLLLLPSQTESFGLVALEAMASGIPVIASDVGGLPEVVAHGETGYLAPVGDVERMGDYAIQLLTDRDLHHRFAHASRERAAARFSYQQIVREYEQVYARLLKAPAPEPLPHLEGG
jgi:N-acetyl-alpha-D-glucosaminyl L-malate synthase BshA